MEPIQYARAAFVVIMALSFTMFLALYAIEGARSRKRGTSMNIGTSITSTVGMISSAFVLVIILPVIL